MNGGFTPTELAALNEYYSMFVELLRDMLCQTALAFLRHYPTYAMARQVNENNNLQSIDRMMDIREEYDKLPLT